MDRLRQLFASRNFRIALFVIAYVLLVAFFVWIVWMVFFRAPSTPPIPNANTNTGTLPNQNTGGPTNGNQNTTVFPGQLPGIDSVARGGATKVNVAVDAPVGSVKIKGGDAYYYNELDDRFYRMGPDGKPILLTDQIFPEAHDIQFSPTNNEAVVSFPDGTNILYNFDRDQQVTLPKQMGEIRFANDGSQIGFEFYQGHPDENFLGVSNPDGSTLTPIEALGDRGHDFAINWSPSKQVVATFRDAEDGVRQKVFFVGQNQENFKALTVDGRGFSGMWTPSGSQIVYSVYSADTDYQPELFIADAVGDRVGANKQSLGLRTFMDKCAFGGTNQLYCAVPNDLPEGAGLNRGLTEGLVDSFYKIDLLSGRTQFLALPVNDAGSPYVISRSLVVNDDESKLYFINQLTGSLEYIALK